MKRKKIKVDKWGTPKNALQISCFGHIRLSWDLDIYEESTNDDEKMYWSVA